MARKRADEPRRGGGRGENQPKITGKQLTETIMSMKIGNQEKRRLKSEFLEVP